MKKHDLLFTEEVEEINKQSTLHHYPYHYIIFVIEVLLYLEYNHYV